MVVDGAGLVIMVCHTKVFMAVDSASLVLLVHRLLWICHTNLTTGCGVGGGSGCVEPLLVGLSLWIYVSGSFLLLISLCMVEHCEWWWGCFYGVMSSPYALIIRNTSPFESYKRIE
jgi:hypothetical protein|uniref:Transmembrane protein n=1 Tax=Picea glauca TaxID=3330 RepID=A0A124GN66_PICGL|nr:hypothetical protein ABT39_MTgene4850 [Picea glauca]QHR88657.1 hypothetical protein Q903MT_gene2671 [Picea sitchensis]